VGQRHAAGSAKDLTIDLNSLDSYGLSAAELACAQWRGSGEVTFTSMAGCLGSKATFALPSGNNDAIQSRLVREVNMRTSMVFVATAMVTGAIAACDGSSTAPARCNVPATTASFADGDQLTGIVTSMILVNGSTAASPTEIVSVDIHDNPDFTIHFLVNTSTAVFERTASAAPTAASACNLTVGQKVQLPASTFLDGFGDYIGASQGNDPAPPLPPVIAQIVIVR
jgi:hypothetical protein